MEAYRLLSLISSPGNNIFVLAFDYRGFGQSSGSPTEHGLTEDAVAVINWALHVARIPPQHIGLVGQSLGTAVAAAAASHFIRLSPKVELGGLVLCAAFVDSASAFLHYSLGGYLPLLGPIRAVGILRKLFEKQIVDTWKTVEYVKLFARESEKLSLTFVHAMDDKVISSWQANELFATAVVTAYGDNDMYRWARESVVSTDLGKDEISGIRRLKVPTLRCHILPHGGMLTGQKRIDHTELTYDSKGHNGIMKSSPVISAVSKLFEDAT